MNSDPTSLARLHDIVEPLPVPWWPPAPGWYLVLAALAVALFGWGNRWRKNYQANAYRRAALRTLQTAKTPTAISELLRRTACAIAPRSQLAALTGENWPAWLSENIPGTMPPGVRAQLAGGMYQQSGENQDIAPLRDYAQLWITQHQLPAASAHSASAHSTPPDSPC